MKKFFIYVTTFIKTLFRQLFSKSGVEEVESEIVQNKRALPRMFRRRVKVKVGELVKMCPGGKHAWYNTDIGLIRKPIL